MSRFVLVHGAWLGAWCWDEVVRHLELLGHEVVVPELPGHGGDPTPVSVITLQSYVDAVAAEMGQDAILVGHSMAGIVISTLAEQKPESVSSLVYLAAYLLQHGEAIAKVAQTDTDSLAGPNMIFAPDWSTVSIQREALQPVFAADAPAAAVERIRTLARPEPAAPFNTPLQLTASRFGSVPRAYICTARDRAVTPSLQSAMLSRTPCPQVVALDSSHTPFFSMPEMLSATLVQLAAQAKEVEV